MADPQLTNSNTTHAMEPEIEQRSPFLSLPGELRNRIYEFVLSAPNGLTPIEPTDTPKKQRRNRSVWNGFSEIEPTDAQKQRAKLQEYGVEILKGKSVVEFNRLKFVNRQLHHETADLELNYNTLTFTRKFEEDSSSSVKLIAFACGLDPHKAGWINRVVLEQVTRAQDQDWHHVWIRRDEDLAQNLSRLEPFARLYPHIQIHYRYQGFNLFEIVTQPTDYILQIDKLVSFMWRAARTTLLIRGQDRYRLMYTPKYEPFFREGAIRSRIRHNLEDLVARVPNLRIWPASDSLSADKFEAELRAWLEYLGDRSQTNNNESLTEQEIGAWVEWLKEIHENGI